MSNEEKAYKISHSPLIEDGIWHYATAEIAAITMAEWKDQQIREIIDKEIDRANRYHDCNLSQIQKAASVRVVSVLCDYLGEEFPKDKFHFGFTTMD